MKVIKIEEDYFASNTYLVVNGNNAIIIDAGAELSNIKNRLREENNPKVNAVFLTHSHYDHILKLDDYLAEFECFAYIMKDGEKKLYNSEFNLSKYFGEEVVLKSSNIKLLKDYEKLNLGTITVEVISTPGHSVDSCCYLIDNLLFTGDLVFNGSIGRTDFPTSNIYEMEKSLNKIKSLPRFEKYFPGHDEEFDYENLLNTLNFYLF